MNRPNKRGISRYFLVNHGLAASGIDVSLFARSKPINSSRWPGRRGFEPVVSQEPAVKPLSPFLEQIHAVARRRFHIRSYDRLQIVPEQAFSSWAIEFESFRGTSQGSSSSSGIPPVRAPIATQPRDTASRSARGSPSCLLG